MKRERKASPTNTIEKRKKRKILRNKFNFIAFKLEAEGETKRQISSHGLFKNKR